MSAACSPQWVFNLPASPSFMHFWLRLRTGHKAIRKMKENKDQLSSASSQCIINCTYQKNSRRNTNLQAPTRFVYYSSHRFLKNFHVSLQFWLLSRLFTILATVNTVNFHVSLQFAFCARQLSSRQLANDPVNS